VVSTFDGAQRTVTLAERVDTANHQGEQELERIISMDYAAIGLTSAPASSTDPKLPGYYVSGTQYKWNQRNTALLETLVTGGTGTLAPSSTWTDGTNRLSGTVARFVTYVYDPNLVQSGTDLPEAKRVTVAVTVNGAGGPNKPIVMSSLVYDKGAA
jgi:hypothetical protein